MGKYIVVLLITLGACHSEFENAERAREILKINDKPLTEPQEGEWLSVHEEPGQTFEAYKSCSPVSPSVNQNIVYLQPIGAFDSIQNCFIRYTADYLQRFYGLKTVVLKTLDNSVVPDSAKNFQVTGREQLMAPYIMNEILKKNMPADAVAMMAITEKDLSPGSSLTFVFGLSSFRDRVGVTSLFRFLEYEYTTEDYTRCLCRLIKISSHEIGHIFSMRHCTNAVCVMNGTNSILETDRKPNRLCSACTAKITWNLKLDPRQRTESLMEFFSQHHLENDRLLAEMDLTLLQAHKF